MTNSFWSKLVLILVGLSLSACDDTQSEVPTGADRGSSGDYEVAYQLDQTQKALVGQYVSRYSSSVSELLSGAGIGYVGLGPNNEEELFEARLEGDVIHVMGNRSVHSKVEMFLSDYFDQDYLQSLFAATEESNREWGVPSTKTEQGADDQLPARAESNGQ